MSEDKNACKWDVLSLSLVLNFVPDPRERGMYHCGVFVQKYMFTPHDFREDAPAGSFVS